MTTQITVHVLIIETRHDTLVSLHRTPADSTKELVEYVDQNWDDEMDGATRPANDDDAIEEYFEAMMGAESYCDYDRTLPKS